jgi:hypothetical protein
MGIFQSVFLFLRAFIMSRAAAAVENLALRQQVAAFKQSVKRPDSRGIPGVFVAILSVVTQFDARPVRGYNCGTEFLGRTGLSVKEPGAGCSSTV